MNLISAILIGNQDKINSILIQHNITKDIFEIIDENDDKKMVDMAVELVCNGRGDIILKGNIKTSILLKSILAKKELKADLLSDLFVFEDPRKMPKLMAITDGGINIAPTLEAKRGIIENGIKLFHALGCPSPKVALLSCTEDVSDKIQSTVDAGQLTKMNREGVIKGCSIYGPLAFDNAINREFAIYKGINSEVAGDPDILVAPNIESGNILAKALDFYNHLKIGHIVMGSTVPILINSRVDKSESRLNSIALAKIVLDYV